METQGHSQTEQNGSARTAQLAAVTATSCSSSADSRRRRIKRKSSGSAEARGRSHLSNKTPEDRVKEYGSHMFRCVNQLLMCQFCEKAVDPRRRSSIEYHLKSYTHMRKVNIGKLSGEGNASTTGSTSDPFNGLSTSKQQHSLSFRPVTIAPAPPLHPATTPNATNTSNTIELGALRAVVAIPRCSDELGSDISGGDSGGDSGGVQKQTVTTTMILDATSAGPVLISQSQPNTVIKLEPGVSTSTVRVSEWPMVFSSGGEPLSSDCSDVPLAPSSNSIMQDGTLSSLCEAQLAEEPTDNYSSSAEERDHTSSCRCCCRHCHHHVREGKTFPNELVLKGRVCALVPRPFMLFELPLSDLTLTRLLTVGSATLGVASKSVKEIVKLPNTMLARDKDVQRLLDFQEIELVLHDCSQPH